MSSYKVNDIITEVRIAIDQNMDDEKLIALSDVNALSLAEIIQSKIIDAAQLMLYNAPLNMCGKGTDFSDESSFTHTEEGLGDGTQYTIVYSLNLPPDFLRLASFRIFGWKRLLREIMTPEDPRYILLRSQFGGMVGHLSHPYLVQVGNRLQIYGCSTTDAKITEAFYHPIPKINTDSDEKKTKTIDIPPLLYRSVIYMTAYLTSISFGAEQQARRLLSLAKNLAGINEQQTLTPPANG